MNLKIGIKLLLVLCSFNLVGQVSFQEFKATYTPNSEKLAPDWDPVKTYNELSEDLYGAAFLFLLGEMESDASLQKNIVGILTSADRAKVAKGIEQLSTADAITLLSQIKDEWVIEIAWFLDQNTYHRLAPNVPAIAAYRPKNPNGFFQRERGLFMPVYAGIGPDLSYSRLKGLNTYVTAYNNWPNKIGPEGVVYNLSEPLDKVSGFKGFHLVAGFKMGSSYYLDLGYQNRSTVARGGGTSPDNWNKAIKFSMHTFDVDLMRMSSPGFISFARGFGLQYSLGTVRDKAAFGSTKSDFQVVGDKVSNFGIKYKIGAFVNPSNLPIVVGIFPYVQVNFTKFDFSSIEAAKPQLGFGGGDPADLKSTGANIGLQLTVAYKFGKVPVQKEYIDFDQEVITAMDPHLNTKYSELAPRVSPDGKTMYFVRGDHPINSLGSLNTQDVWVSDISNGLENATAVHMQAPFNTDQYNNVMGVSPDENTLMINGAVIDGVKGRGYSMIERTETGWSAPVALDIEGYREMSLGNYASMYWTQDGKHLMLSFSESKDVQMQDLYVSHLQENGSWSRPANLGNTINTTVGEHSPFLASDGTTLYFSSNRDGGEGDYDIWMSKRLDDSWTNWSAPVNMGTTINTEDFEAYYTIDARGEYAYMVSANNSIGEEDIIRVELTEKQKPNPVVLISGTVLNATTNKPLSATISYNGLTDGKNYGFARTNPATGEYKMVLPYGVKYDFTAIADNFVGISETIDLTAVGAYQEISKDLFLVPLTVGSVVRLNNIFFDFGASTLKEESYSELNRLVKLLNENPAMKVELGGHTDDVGNAETNKKLSQNRANACKAYLISKGIDEGRLVAVGYGKEQPVAANSTEEGKAKNRRVEFKILGV